ncbi:MAG: hypothetical protein SFX73_13050 [Kofleriaceae bacterium]|nr:hypothetical protein [Kofleriaceae bacterium]
MNTSIIATLALVATSGCSVLLDTIYVAGDKKFATSTVERKPTQETLQNVEYSAHIVDGGLELSCAQTTRSIDRTWSVHKTWQRRGGFDRNAYMGTAFTSGFFGAITGGVLLGMCLSEEANVDCAWTAAAAPLFLDMGYGIIRRSMTKEPKLIARERSGDSVELGAIIESSPGACPVLTDVAIGYATGHAPETAFRMENPEPQRLDTTNAAHLPLAGTVATLTPVIAESWAASAGLWAIDANGVAHAVSIDRCAALRPYAAQMSTTNQNRFNTECPLPPGQLGVPQPPPQPAPQPQQPY